jgi:hypothetical protein
MPLSNGPNFDSNRTNGEVAGALTVDPGKAPARMVPNYRLDELFWFRGSLQLPRPITGGYDRRGPVFSEQS